MGMTWKTDVHMGLYIICDSRVDLLGAVTRCAPMRSEDGGACWGRVAVQWKGLWKGNRAVERCHGRIRLWKVCR